MRVADQAISYVTAALLASVLFCLPAADAMAQTGAPRDLPNSAPREAPRDEKGEPKRSPALKPGGEETLSDRLDRTDGVIKPPADVAPSMRVPPPVPEPRTTPVIPPSALPDTPRQ